MERSAYSSPAAQPMAKAAGYRRRRVCILRDRQRKRPLLLVLRHYAYGWAEGFALGDAARILLYEPDFVSAHLSTFDGVDFFSVGIKLANIEFSIGNPALVETDEFDLFP
jgi:hypothetical protein